MSRRATPQEIRVAKTPHPKLPRWMRYDPILWVIVAIFVVFEFVAHFGFHNEVGMQTLSNRVASFIKAFGWPARILVGLACAVLTAHLQGVF